VRAAQQRLCVSSRDCLRPRDCLWPGERLNNRCISYNQLRALRRPLGVRAPSFLAASRRNGAANLRPNLLTFSRNTCRQNIAGQPLERKPLPSVQGDQQQAPQGKAHKRAEEKQPTHFGRSLSAGDCLCEQMGKWAG